MLAFEQPSFRLDAALRSEMARLNSLRARGVLSATEHLVARDRALVRGLGVAEASENGASGWPLVHQGLWALGFVAVGAGSLAMWRTASPSPEGPVGTSLPGATSTAPEGLPKPAIPVAAFPPTPPPMPKLATPISLPPVPATVPAAPAPPPTPAMPVAIVPAPALPADSATPGVANPPVVPSPTSRPSPPPDQGQGMTMGNGMTPGQPASFSGNPADASTVAPPTLPSAPAGSDGTLSPPQNGQAGPGFGPPPGGGSPSNIGSGSPPEAPPTN